MGGLDSHLIWWLSSSLATLLPKPRGKVADCPTDVVVVGTVLLAWLLESSSPVLGLVTPIAGLPC